MNKIVRAAELRVLGVSMKMAYFVSLSTTTRMSEHPLETGNCSIKSIDIEFQEQRGTNSCFNRP